MSPTPMVNLYCDESAHLEHDHLRWMVLGGLRCPAEKVRESAVRLREIKARHGLAPGFEAKWVKVSPAKVQLYIDLLDYFLDDDDLTFRAVVIDKAVLAHDRFQQSHDDWYYKMWFQLLVPMLHPKVHHNVYLDIKDTRSQAKIEHLRQVICDSKHDFDRKIIQRVQHVRSHEVEHVQLVDLLIGAIATANRDDVHSQAKHALVERLRARSRKSLRSSTLLHEEKLNLFFWRGDQWRS
jgi:hypothetical protein